MAGEWIKIECVTPDKEEVVQLAVALDIDQDAVVGKLVRFWSWAEEQRVSDGVNEDDDVVVRVNYAFIDRLVYCAGFAAGLVKVGWLLGRDGRLTIPRFCRHNGQKAKERAMGAKRARSRRKEGAAESAEITCHENVTEEALQEKEKEKEKERSKEKERESKAEREREGSTTVECRSAGECGTHSFFEEGEWKSGGREEFARWVRGWMEVRPELRKWGSWKQLPADVKEAMLVCYEAHPDISEEDARALSAFYQAKEQPAKRFYRPPAFKTMFLQMDMVLDSARAWYAARENIRRREEAARNVEVMSIEEGLKMMNELREEMR